MGGDQGGYGDGVINMAGGKLIWRGDHVSYILTNYVAPGRIIAYGGIGTAEVKFVNGNTEITGAIIDMPYASEPYPNGLHQVLKDTIFHWKPGDYAAKHNVYFGTDLSDVSQSATPVSFQQDANSYEPGLLD